MFTSKGERFVPKLVRFRLADTLLPTIALCMLPPLMLKTGMEWPRTVTVTVALVPLLSAGTFKALLLPVTVIVPV